MKRILILATAVAVTLLSCSTLPQKNASEVSISGYAQKGQFIKGSSITAYGLDENLIPTGTSFPSTINDDLGSFTIKSRVSEPYLELKAEGYYFNENLGEISASPIYLNALVCSDQKNVNINLLTTFISGRVKALLEDGRDFQKAKQQAEYEFLKIFTGTTEDYGIDGVENLNISDAGEGNAILLAISCLIQQGRNPGEIQNLISKISSEFQQSGTLPSALLCELRSFEGEINAIDIIEHLTQFYADKEIENYNIPPFYNFIKPNQNQIFRIVGPGELIPEGDYNYAEDGGLSKFNVVSLQPFTIESDVPWISFKTTDLFENYYEITEIIAPNNELGTRTGHLIFKMNNGELLYTKEICQKGTGVRIYIKGTITTKSDFSASSSEFKAGDLVNVNGNVYKVQMNNGYPYVDVLVSQTGYGVSGAPDVMAPASDGDPYHATINIPSVVNEFIPKFDDTVLSGTRSLPYGDDMDMPTYGVAERIDHSDCMSVTFNPFATLIVFKFKNQYPQLSKIVLRSNEGALLSGEVTVSLKQESGYPKYINPQRELTVVNKDENDEIGFLVHPDNLNELTVEVYDMTGKLLSYLTRKVNFKKLSCGGRYMLTFE